MASRKFRNKATAPKWRWAFVGLVAVAVSLGPTWSTPAFADSGLTGPSSGSDAAPGAQGFGFGNDDKRGSADDGQGRIDRNESGATNDRDSVYDADPDSSAACPAWGTPDLDLIV
ncbi:MAG: hypothetical protein AAFQ44_10495 [Pseudomonadota bacterium]